MKSQAAVVVPALHAPASLAAQCSPAPAAAGASTSESFYIGDPIGPVATTFRMPALAQQNRDPMNVSVPSSLPPTLTTQRLEEADDEPETLSAHFDEDGVVAPRHSDEMSEGEIDDASAAMLLPQAKTSPRSLGPRIASSLSLAESVQVERDERDEEHKRPMPVWDPFNLGLEHHNFSNKLDMVIYQEKEYRDRAARNDLPPETKLEVSRRADMCASEIWF